MAQIIDSILSKYNYLMDDLADSRTKDLPLLSSPIPMIMIVVVYLKFCINYGPSFMKDRKPYELKYPIMLYNIFQILYSIMLVYEGTLYFVKDFDIMCDPLVTTTDDPRLIRAARSSWLYFFAKITELLDTVFFVFRKKSRQISTLHLFHHSMVVASAWMFTKYFPGGPIILVGTLNSFVHIIMYSYYLISGLGPQFQKAMWWKKYITILQLVQFVIIITHNTIGLFNECNYPKAVHLYIIANTGYVMFMFSQFYYNNYIKVSPKKNEELTGKLKKKNAINNNKKISAGQ